MPRSIPLTNQGYEALRLQLEKRLEQDHAFALALAGICGSPERMQLFLSPAGVSISSFAHLLGTPASTVRHYQRLGLITPFEVNGKFRFWLHNLVQAQAVQQWRNLGLNLTEIQALRAEQRLGAEAVLFNYASLYELSAVVTDKTLKLRVTHQQITPENGQGRQWLDFPLSSLKSEVSLPESPPISLIQLRIEITAAREKLELQLREVQEKVQRAKQLELILQELT